ncbi:OmpH family outer membrane protein [Chitinophaga nivalis]|uniref:OmpH family outer membrane protein n=1 Tax=Chitinophaga nivalis TaxID=2991709 RepID=A0ABT3IF96_9BACT|nr:OmpH family outer membrane protein [Chitinophaga nivalis]MCW3467669.1 OmpH family outer membrane protein [Chitinophaga nivalis]MCW3482639.1 OmpH family outer membrane protein [Chitinophaga nivalis]
MRTRKQFVTKGLLAALAAGLFMACQGNKSGNSATSANSDPAANPTAPAAAGFKIAYVDMDSLEAHFDYFKEKKSQLEQKQQQMENQLKGKANALRSEYEDLQRKASTLTQEQGETAQRSLMAKQQQLEQEAQNMRASYSEQEAKFTEELQKKLDDYLKGFNADKRYAFIFSYRAGQSNILYRDQAYDVTSEVIKGINEKGATPAK